MEYGVVTVVCLLSMRDDGGSAAALVGFIAIQLSRSNLGEFEKPPCQMDALGRSPAFWTRMPCVSAVSRETF